MAVPTSYTEESYVAFLSRELGALGGVLDWNAAKWNDVTNDALRAYGVDDIDDATDTGKLEALGRVCLWQAAIDGLASYYNFSDPGGSSSESDLQRNAVVALRNAQRRASRYVSIYSVRSTRIVRDDDPYAVVSSAEFEP